MIYSLKDLEFDIPVSYLPEFAKLITHADRLGFPIDNFLMSGWNDRTDIIWLASESTLYSIVYSNLDRKFIFVMSDYDVNGEFVIYEEQMKEFLNGHTFEHDNINDLFNDLLLETEKGRFEELSNAVKETYIKF